MAILISKVVRSGSNSQQDGLQGSSSRGTELNHGNSRIVISGGRTTNNPTRTFLRASGQDIEARGGSSGSQTPLSMVADKQGIVKTVETMVLVDEPHKHGQAQDR